MREWNECRAEVFRRMEAGIKERKRKRKWAIACCIPLCLCLLVLTAVDPHWSIDPGAMPEGTSNQTPEDAPETIVGAEGWTNTPGLGADGPLSFSAQYIRTNGCQEGAKYPIVKIIRSVDELNAYYAEQKDNYDLERKEQVYVDTTIGFLDACDQYDESYFAGHFLVMVLLEEGSGSIRHRVDAVDLAGGALAIHIGTIVPEVGTDDMAQWHILIELEADAYVSGEDDVAVYLNGNGPANENFCD